MIVFQVVMYKYDQNEKLSQCIKHPISINSAQDGNDQCNSIFKYLMFVMPQKIFDVLTLLKIYCQ